VHSTPPPLPCPTSYQAIFRASPTHVSLGEQSRFNWPAILVSAAMSLVLVAGVFAWIATHPLHAAPPLLAMSGVVKDTAAEPPKLPAPPHAPVLSTIAALPLSAAKETIADNVPRLQSNPPPLPPPAFDHHPSSADKEPDRAGSQPPPRTHPVGESYGTQVPFRDSRETAAGAARKEHKLLFVMHISGNFEDSCFT
jgi:hypothetical protein